MLIIGILLIVLALVVPALHILFWIGVVLLVVGAVLAIAGHSGRTVGGRTHWF